MSRREALAQILSDDESIRAFYCFKAMNPHLEIYDACQIIMARPNAEVCYSLENWNAWGRWVIKGRKGIAYFDRFGQRRHVFDDKDTQGELKYQSQYMPIRRLLQGIDELNGSNLSQERGSDYQRIERGVEQYLSDYGYLTDDAERNTFLCEGVAYSLYCSAGKPKEEIKLHGMPYSYEENGDLFNEVILLTTVMRDEVMQAYRKSRLRAWENPEPTEQDGKIAEAQPEHAPTPREESENAAELPPPLQADEEEWTDEEIEEALSEQGEPPREEESEDAAELPPPPQADEEEWTDEEIEEALSEQDEPIQEEGSETESEDIALPPSMLKPSAPKKEKRPQYSPLYERYFSYQEEYPNAIVLYVTYIGDSDWEQESVARTVRRAVKIECTFSFKIDYHVHSYTSTVTKPTCTTDGYTTHRCSCGYSYTDNPTSALGHSYSATTTPATCTSGGYTTNRCTRCGNTYTSNQSNALGHSYDSTTTPPTCTAEGYTTHVCSRCKTTYVDSRIPALGHSYTVETSATCTGEKFVYTCSRCHYSYTDYTDENGTGHSFTTKTTAATCTEAGYTIYTCTKCGYSYRDTVSNALGHNYKATVVSPKCTEGGYTLYTCSRCGDEYRSGATEASGHSYVERTYPATCTEGSYTLHECSRCGESYRDNVSQPLGHNYETSEEPPTCTEGGKTVYLCQVCGHRREDRDGSLPTGHSYTSIVLTPATCTTNGQRQMTCENCGYGYVETIRAKGHNYSITSSTTENGKTTRRYVCQTCGDSYTQELGDQYENVSNYVEYLFEQYAPYMYWVLLATAGLWSIAIGVAIIIATKNEDKAKAKKMLVNYLIGLVVIFVIVVACPYLVRGIAAFVT